MLRNKWISLTVILLALASLANAGPIGTAITVFPTLGPNYWLSPSYNAFAQNVIDGILGGLPSLGSGYAAYNVVSTISPNQPIVSTPFESWQGVYSPGSGEYGTALYFAVHIFSSELFSLSQMSYDETSPAGPYHWDYTTDTYAFDRIGRTTGGSWITSGAGTQQINELIYVGEFLSWEPGVYTGPGNEQADLDLVACCCLGGYCYDYITAQYSLNLAPPAPPISGTGAVNFTGGICDVPEPGTVAVAAIGVAAMFFARRRRTGS